MASNPPEPAPERIPSDPSQLRSENEALNEQIKLLVQTEQRLYRFKNELDRQFSRIRALGDFALECARLESPKEILARALKLLLGNFNLDHAVAVHADRETDRLRIVHMHVGGNLQETTAEASDEMLAWVGGMSQTELMRVGPEMIEHLRPVGESMREEYEGESAEDWIDAAAVVMPLRVAAGELFGFVLACKKTRGAKSYFRERPDDAHLSFLRLLANHLERALQNAVLTSDLRERREQLSETNRRLTASVQNLESAQQQLLQAQKMEAIGRLAGGVAHDFNNLLTVIIGHAQVLQDRLTDDSRGLHDLDSIVEACNRAAEIIRHLLAFGRKQKRSPETVEINELVKSTARMLGRLIGEHIRLDIRADAEAGCVRADRAQLEQILMNLVVNARDAMPDGGRLTIATRRATPDEGENTPNPFDVSQYVAIDVSDTGHGMDSATREQIFEPFFTTKEVGSGTGLGLATVYGLVRQNEGIVRVSSEIGSGSRFTVLFPSAARSATEPVGRAEEAPWGPTEATILLAEDESNIRSLLAEVLRGRGFEVLVAENGEEALELAARHEGSIDLLVCDVVMPSIGGPDLARRLRRDSPDLPVLFVSGYTFDAMSAGELSGEPFLQKPFTPAALVDSVRKLLSRSGGRPRRWPRRRRRSWAR
ncbi:MAG: hybrid sensor histidine kinase/response regulator [Planctomycetota bacterium]